MRTWRELDTLDLVGIDEHVCSQCSVLVGWRDSGGELPSWGMVWEGENGVLLCEDCVPQLLTPEESIEQLMAAAKVSADKLLAAWKERDALHDEVAKLARWKREATVVLGQWDAVWDAAGRPGALGQSKAAGVGARLAALDRIVRAWTVEGPSPDTHRDSQKSLRWRWPALGAALDVATKESP